MEDIYSVIRSNIKKYRKMKNMTQAKLAEKVDLSHDYMRQIESKKIAKCFSVQTFYDISKALEVTMDTLSKKEEKEKK